MKKIILGIAAAALLVSGTANSAFIMYLDDLSTGGKDVVVQDDSLAGLLTSIGATTNADSDAREGVVTYSGSLAGFNISFAMGASKPQLTGPNSTIFDLISLQISGGSGNIEIGLTDTGFTGDHNLTFGIGGTTDGSVSAAAFLDLTNAEFGQGTQLGSFSGSGGAVSYNSDTTYLSGVTNPYSLTLITSVNHGANGASSFDAAISVPEPSVIALFGLGLVGIGYAGRRKRIQ